jgi:glycosyltransferase involved in cell wall biosynthesis
MRTVAIYLGGTPTDGGTYQNALSLVAALAELPPEDYATIGYHTNDAWAHILFAHGLAAHAVERQGALSRAVTKALRELPVPLALRKRAGSLVVPFGRQLRADGVDVCLYPNFEHYAWELATPSIGIIHDLMHRYEPHFPEVSEPGIPEHRDRMFSRMRLGATAVLVDSELGRRQVIESYGTQGASLHVLPYVAPGYVWDVARGSGRRQADAESATLARWADEAGIPGRFLFYPAQFWEHKNHVRLLRAFARLRAQRPDAALVLVGSAKNAGDAVRSEIERLGLADAIRVLGYVTNEQMVYLYRHARALVMPTFFGPTNIPPLEAMALGCPVAVSGIYAMPEIYGDAALYFDPRSEDEIADAVVRLWTDDDLVAELRERGLARAASWTPAGFAGRLREIIDAVVRRSRPRRSRRARGAR